MARVTGIGGVFFKATSNETELAKWYAANLGFELESFGAAILKWPDDKAEDRGITVWHVAKPETEWFSPSAASFMINYRVDDMAGMIERLKSNGTEILKGPETHENGVFMWILDPNGNKVELWEPKIWRERDAQA